jgi:nucleotide-binding universal stress UspA family protein
MSRILVKEGEEVLERAKKYCADKGITSTTQMEFGDAGVEIISLSKKENFDLIVIGSHGKSGLDRVLIGSVSSFVVTHNKRKTLVVRG